MTVKKATLWTLFWVVLTAIFNIGIYFYMGSDKALEFLGGYIIEQSLSLDNLFLFVIIFDNFRIEPRFQRRVLNYGITGAVILRLVFIVAGLAVVESFHWILGVFGLILIFSGIKILTFENEAGNDLKNSLIIRILRKFIPISQEVVGEKFLIRKNKILYATPLLAILVLVEVSDIIFAIDSIPAIFSITTDSFIVFTSNIFAIMGLRNIYFLLEKVHRSFRFVKYGVALILVFTGIKLCLASPYKFSFNGFHVETLHVEIPIMISIGIITGLLALSVFLSVIFQSITIRKNTVNVKSLSHKGS